MYLVAGMVAKNYAGPGVIFSFIIAAIASIFSGGETNLHSFQQDRVTNPIEKALNSTTSYNKLYYKYNNRNI